MPFHTTRLLTFHYLFWTVAGAALAGPPNYPGNRPPLQPSAFIPLPLGAVKPSGWLRDQLVVQANGMTGHLDEFWKSVSESAWKGGPGDPWERGPYYLDGLVPLAYELDDARLKEKVRTWIEPILGSQRADGWFGPTKNKDRWPLSVALKVLTQYYEATGDERAMKVIKGYIGYLKANKPDWPDKEWRGVRAMENSVTLYWYYNRTGDADALEVAKSIHDNSFNWADYFLHFPFPREKIEAAMAAGKPLKGHLTHVVNIAMAIKYPGLWWQQSDDGADKRAVFDGIKALDENHGQVGGRFSGDEHLSGTQPTQGTETCAVVEYMYSLENLLGIYGDAALADRLEMLAYNAVPGAQTEDYWCHQYDQQANQVLVSVAKRNWSTNKDDSNIYGLEPNFGCCTANMHQGLPKFVSHMWMATPDGGLAAVAYGPSVVTAKVADGVQVTIKEGTEYPFGSGPIGFLIVEGPASIEFPLSFRLPSWAKHATAWIGSEKHSFDSPGWKTIRRVWKKGDIMLLDLPLYLHAETRRNNSVSLYRGPLVYALKIGEERKVLKSHHDSLPVKDYEISPTTPWNYGLLLDCDHPEDSIRIEEKPGDITSRSANASEVRAMSTKLKTPFSSENARIVLHVKGRQIPEWKLEKNSAGPVPQSPVDSSEHLTDLELIPYGSTRLRISEFPTLKD